MKFTTAIITLSAVAALVQAASPLTATPAGPIVQKLMGAVDNVAPQKRDAPGVKTVTDTLTGALGGLRLGGASAQAQPTAAADPNGAPMGAADLVQKRVLGEMVASLTKGLQDLPAAGAATGALSNPGALPGAASTIPISTEGTNTNVDKRDVDAKIAADINAEVKAALKACADIVANVDVRVKLVAEILAKIEANLGIHVDADVKAKIEAAINVAIDLSAKVKAVVDIDAQIKAALDLVAKADVKVVVKVAADAVVKVNALIDAKVKALIKDVDVKVMAELKACIDANADVKAVVTANANVLGNINLAAKVNLDIQAILKALLEVAAVVDIKADVKAIIDAIVDLKV